MFIDFKERGREGEGEKKKCQCERNIDDLNLQPRYVPCPEIKPQPIGVWDDIPTS